MRQNACQSRMQTFLAYTQRYQDIIVNLPVDVESDTYSLDELPEADKDDFLRWLRSYYDLCSEEFYLNDEKMLDRKVWRLWEAGMRDSLKKPAFSQAWRAIQGNGYYDAKFARYIEGILEEHNHA